MVPNAPKRKETHQNMSLGSNGVDREHTLWKIPARLRGTNFCINRTSLAHFRAVAKWSQMHPNGKNAPKHELRVQWYGSGAFVAKNSDTTSWHKLLHHFGPFCTEFCMATKRSQIFVWQPNGPKCSQIVQKHNKTWVYSPMGWTGAFVVKNSDATSWHLLLHQFGPFWTECCNATNYPKCIQIVRNATEHEVRIQWGGSNDLL